VEHDVHVGHDVMQLVEVAHVAAGRNQPAVGLIGGLKVESFRLVVVERMEPGDGRAQERLDQCLADRARRTGDENSFVFVEIQIPRHGFLLSARGHGAEDAFSARRSDSTTRS
jgi:hypothetical protein